MTIHGIALEGAAPLTFDAGVTEEPTGGITIDNTIIEGDRWGSSGYYPAEVLERDGARAFPAGTQVFMDHAEVGKDSVHNLIGELKEAARFVPAGDGQPSRLMAPMHFYSDRKQWVKERAKTLGISIRSGVTFAQGVREGRAGKIVESFTEAISVDVVTRAGAGGKFGTIKESEQFAQTTQEEEEGANMPLSKDEMTELATLVSTGVAEALKQPFADLTNVVKESAPKAKTFTAAEVSQKITEAKLGKTAGDRVWAAFEAKSDVAEAIATEAAIREEYAPSKRVNTEGKEIDADGHLVVEKTDETATEGSLPSGWGVVATEVKS